MRWHGLVTWGAILAGTMCAAAVRGQEPPVAQPPAPEKSAAQMVDDEVTAIAAEFRTTRDELLKKLTDELLAAQDKFIAQLKALQDKYAKDGKLEEAIRVRDRIRIVQGGLFVALPDPGNLEAYKSQVGNVLFFRVTGATGGEVYGSEIYSSDSDLATAAVHAGVLKFGDTQVVMVKILPAKSSFQGSDRFGITSKDWGMWPGSYRIDPVPAQGVPLTPMTPMNPGAARTPTGEDLRN
jgi:hypothetical protein